MQAKDKTVLITGGGSGIGLAIAAEFLNQGSKVIICGRTLARLEKAQKRYPSLGIAQCDITDNNQIEALRDKCNNEYGGIDILVNNAGIFHAFDMAQGQFPIEKQLKEIDVDFGGPVRMVHYFLPDLLKKSEAAIVNVSSSLAFIPYAAGPVYSATKAAEHSWTLSMRNQLAGTTVKVFELMPPLVDTEMVADVEGIPKMPPEKLGKAFINGFLRDRYEIAPGIGGALRVMRRLAPRFTMHMLNR